MVVDYKSVKPKHHPVEIKIVLTDDIPVAQRPIRMSYRCAVDGQINEWLRDGIITKSSSEYSAKDGSRRLCCDYRIISLWQL